MPPPAPPPPVSRWRWLALLGVILVYSWLFYSGGELDTDGATPRRIVDLMQLLVPESLLGLWTGDDWRRLFPWEWLDRLAAAAVAVVWAGAAWSAGWLVLERAGLTASLGRCESLAFSWGVGASLLSTIALGLGLCGVMAPLVYYALAATLISLGAWRAMVAWRGTGAGWTDGRGHRRHATDTGSSPGASTASTGEQAPWVARRAGWLAAPFLWLLVLAALMPPWEFDVREYHLQAPKEWHRLGRVAFLPHNVYADMPLGAEAHALATICLMPGEHGWWHGALSGKLVMALFAPFGALGLAGAGRRWWSPTVGAVAGLVYLSTPWVFRSAVIGHNEAVIGCLAWLGLHALWLARDESMHHGQTRNEPESRPSLELRWIASSGLLSGAAAGCKYTAVVFVAAPLFVLAIVQASRPRRVTAAWVFAVAALLGGGLWYAKSAWSAGNPTYPLLYSLLGGAGWDAERAARWSAAHSPHGFHLGQLLESARVVLWDSPAQGLLLVPLALFGAWDRRCPPQRRALTALLVVGVVVWWFATHRLDRFLVPLFPFVALFAGVGATWSNSPAGRRVISAFVLLGLVSSWLFLARGGAVSIGDGRILASLKQLRTDEVRVHVAHRFLNREVPQDRRVLTAGEAQVFDLEPDTLYATCFDPCPLPALLQGKSPEEQRSTLQRERISHVFIAWGEIARYQSPGNYGFTGEVTRAWIHQLVADRVLVPLQVVDSEGVLLDQPIRQTTPDELALWQVYQVGGW